MVEVARNSLLEEALYSAMEHFDVHCSKKVSKLPSTVQDNFKALAQELIEGIVGLEQHKTLLGDTDKAKDLYNEVGMFVGKQLGNKFEELELEPQVILQRLNKGTLDGLNKETLFDAVHENFANRNVDKIVVRAMEGAERRVSNKVEGANVMGRLGEFVSKASELRGKEAYAAGIYAMLTGLSGYLALNHLSKTASKDPITGERHMQWNQLTWAGVNAAIAGLMAISLHTVVKGRG